MKSPAIYLQLLSLVVLSVRAAQTDLSPANFKQSISQGVWQGLVEYHSPYCPHCREFASTWARLRAENEKSSDPGIYLAQVDCALHGDFCQENGVQSFPQLNLYRAGGLVELYKGQRDFDHLQAYISGHAEPTTSTPSPPHEPSLPTPTEPLHFQAPRRDANPSGTVLVLDATNFDKTVEQGPVFVKFFAPWCGHCKRLAPTWSKFAQHMQYKIDIAEVNCDENAPLCRSQHIQGYPTLVFFSSGDKSEYTGGRKIEQLINFADEVSAPAVRELVDGDLEPQIAYNAVMYLLIHTDTADDIMKQVIQASRILLGSPPIYSSSSPDLFSRYNIPATSRWALLVFKGHDSAQPTARFYPGASGDSQRALSKWLLEHRLPMSMELTQDNFQQVMNAPHQPLVVIAAVTKDSKDRVARKFWDFGKMWNVRKGQHNGISKDVVFTWMDAEKWASWLKSMYGIKAEADSEPAIIVADHARLFYYDADPNGKSIKLTFPSISSTIDGISSGIIAHKYSENFVERMSRYLSGKIVSVEIYVGRHPWQFLSFIAFILAFGFFCLKHFVLDDTGGDVRENRHGYGKSTRLD